MAREMDAGFQCAGRGERNQITVDESAGRSLSCIEDGPVCWRPNVLVEFDPREEEFVIQACLESV